MANSLNEAGAKEVVRLLNDDARKDRIVAVWERLLAKAGDTIVFSYAGHGGQEPAPPDRHDKTHIESFLLGHFEPSGPGTRERIVDDEVFVWLQQADRKGVKVVFVADSCHSGGMERSASAPGVKFRRMVYPAITDDQLQFPPPETSEDPHGHQASGQIAYKIGGEGSRAILCRHGAYSLLEGTWKPGAALTGE